MLSCCVPSYTAISAIILLLSASTVMVKVKVSIRVMGEHNELQPHPATHLICTALQIWCGDGTLPADVEALAGGFTDAENPCQLEEAAEGVARLWRYQGFRL